MSEGGLPWLAKVAGALLVRKERLQWVVFFVLGGYLARRWLLRRLLDIPQLDQTSWLVFDFET